MSSGTFAITIVSRPNENWSIWRVRNTVAGGANDFVTTRSFAFSAIYPYAKTLFPEIKNTSDLTSENWYKQNVDKYIRHVTFFVRANVQKNNMWPNNYDDLMYGEKFDSKRHKEDKLCETLHHVYLAVEVVNPICLDALPEVFETTAFDWWWRDPRREKFSSCVMTYTADNLAKIQKELAKFIEEIRDGSYP